MLLDVFESKKGYKLEKHIPDLIIPGPEAGRTRCDYFDVIADLYRENYHGVIRKWCENHGIQYCPHLLGEESMAGHVRFSGDYMRQTKEMSLPGIDHLGKGIGSLNIKFAASAAEVYGKDSLACEVFAACGWELTFDEYLRMISWLFSQGVRTIVNHGFFYSTRDFRYQDWPPSQFFQWQGWERMPEANAMCRRLYGMFSESRRKTDVLIYHPTETYWLHYIADQGFKHGYNLGPIILDERAAEIDRYEQIILNRLLEQNIDFTVFPSDAVDHFRVDNGKIINLVSGQKYSTFVLPMCEIIPLAVTGLIDEFTRQGGTLLVIDSIPSLGIPRSTDDEIEKLLSQIMSRQSVTWQKDLGDIDGILAWFRQNVPQKLRILSNNGFYQNNHLHYPDWISDPYIHTGEDIDGVAWNCYEKDGHDMYFFVNFSKQEQIMLVELESDGVPEVWDTLSGQIESVEVQGRQVRPDGKTTTKIQFTLPYNHGVFLLTANEVQDDTNH